MTKDLDPCPSKDVPGPYCPENGQFTTGGYVLVRLCSMYEKDPYRPDHGKYEWRRQFLILKNRLN